MQMFHDCRVDPQGVRSPQTEEQRAQVHRLVQIWQERDVQGPGRGLGLAVVSEPCAIGDACQGGVAAQTAAGTRGAGESRGKTNPGGVVEANSVPCKASVCGR